MRASPSSVNVVTVFFHAPVVSYINVLYFCTSDEEMLNVTAVDLSDASV